MRRINSAAKTDKALMAEVIAVSRANPKCAVTYMTIFDRATIYIYASLGRLPIDSPDTRFMLGVHPGKIAFVNGKLTPPTQGYKNRLTAYELRTGGPND